MRALALAVLLAVAPTAPAVAQLPDDTSGLLGRYGGSYLCGDREHGFFLELTRLSPAEDGAGYAASGVIGFFPILSGLDDRGTGPTGSFIASGRLAPNGALTLTREDWLFQALGYGTPNLEGKLSVRVHGGFELRGRILFSSNPGACSDVMATKFQSPPPPLPADVPG